MTTTNRLAKIVIDERSLGSTSRDIDYERKAAMRDLMQDNVFAPASATVDGPYALHLGERDGRRGGDLARERARCGRH